MRIRRSVTRFFGALLIPAVCIAITGYYGYYLLAGPRGLLALADARARLDVANANLAQVRVDEARITHRIALLKAQDPDLIQELARQQMLGTEPGQISVPRNGH